MFYIMEFPPNYKDELLQKIVTPKEHLKYNHDDFRWIGLKYPGNERWTAEQKDKIP